MSIASCRRHLLIALAGGAWVTATGAEQTIPSKRVQFAKGSNSATVTGSIKGYQSIDYLVRARKGQSASISLGTRHGATYFNLMAPGQTEEAFFVGSTRGNQFEGTLPADGDYRIRVYMMRSAARRNETANYRLEIVISAAAGNKPVASIDAKVPGTDFHATGELRCTMADGQPAASCAFGVKRRGQGSAMVHVTRPDGRKRVIFFEMGRATGYDMSQADQGTFKAVRAGDVTTVHIGGERYQIVDAVIFGG
jgi:hypothetical protein